MADRADIDRVREATDLVELISEVTTVKRSGRSFMAVCPFHQEKSASMSVDRARGLYHCFGCGKGGDVFSFVQETQAVEFGDALELLARKAGVTLTHDAADARDRGRRAAAVDAIRQAIEVYHRRLRSAAEAGPARAYLRGRGYDAELIDEWKLGFAGVDWDTLTKELKSAGVDDRVMIDAGLSRRGRQGLFDVFRGRLMFPIHDLRGDAVGFGGAQGRGNRSPGDEQPGCQVREFGGLGRLSQEHPALRAGPGPKADLRGRSGGDRRGLHRCDRDAPGGDRHRHRHLRHCSR